MPGIAGLSAGLSYVIKRTPALIIKKESALTGIIESGLRQMPEIIMYEPKDPAEQTGVVSFNIRGVPSETAADELGSRGIAVRAGLSLLTARPQKCRNDKQRYGTRQRLRFYQCE